MTVYVVQNQRKLDRDTNKFVPKFDLSSAEEFGKIDFVLGPTAAPFLNDKAINEIHEKLTGFTSDDYLLLIGNPVFIGIIAAIAALYSGGDIQFLQWHGVDKKYQPIIAEDIFRADEEDEVN